MRNRRAHEWGPVHGHRGRRSAPRLSSLATDQSTPPAGPGPPRRHAIPHQLSRRGREARAALLGIRFAYPEHHVVRRTPTGSSSPRAAARAAVNGRFRGLHPRLRRDDVYLPDFQGVIDGRRRGLAFDLRIAPCRRATAAKVVARSAYTGDSHDGSTSARRRAAWRAALESSSRWPSSFGASGGSVAARGPSAERCKGGMNDLTLIALGDSSDCGGERVSRSRSAFSGCASVRQEVEGRETDALGNTLLAALRDGPCPHRRHRTRAVSLAARIVEWEGAADLHHVPSRRLLRMAPYWLQALGEALCGSFGERP